MRRGEVIDDLGVVNGLDFGGNSLQAVAIEACMGSLDCMPIRLRSSACFARDNRMRMPNYGMVGDGLPITSPVTTMSTRRLSWRPAAVLLSATGSALPRPRAVT